jgi:hypothetical protein|tara:strand:- start:407 stop:508 length:102 start_codon:yes stop_codon:yes gene_type:complete
MKLKKTIIFLGILIGFQGFAQSPEEKAIKDTLF